MKTTHFILLAFLLWPISGRAEEPLRFIREDLIPGTSMRVFVAEGEYEPRSIGSYSLLIYEVSNERFPYDGFITGTVHPRDGTVEDVQFSDVDGDGEPEIIVVMRSAGSGGYLSADAYDLEKKRLTLLSSVSGLSEGADPLSSLVADIQKTGDSLSLSIKEKLWMWSVMAEAESSSRKVIVKPEKYTLIFYPVGRVEIRADCNILLGSYILEEYSLAINASGPSTMAFCGEQSLDREFLGFLALVERYEINNGRLVLHLQEAGRKMILTNNQ